MLYVTDDGQSVISQAGRVNKSYRNQGIISYTIDRGK